jgi:hypothetical protein
MRGSLILSLFLIVSFLLLSGCGIASQADAAAKELEAQSIPTTTSLTTTNIKPAAFSVSGLTIEPREVATGELFTISVTVTNTGGSQGSYDAILYIEEINTEDPENVIIISAKTFTKSITIAAGESKELIFDSLSLGPGIYTATIDELVDYFEVGC